MNNWLEWSAEKLRSILFFVWIFTGNVIPIGQPIALTRPESHETECGCSKTRYNSQVQEIWPSHLRRELKLIRFEIKAQVMRNKERLLDLKQIQILSTYIGHHIQTKSWIHGASQQQHQWNDSNRSCGLFDFVETVVHFVETTATSCLIVNRLLMQTRRYHGRRSLLHLTTDHMCFVLKLLRCEFRLLRCAADNLRTISMFRWLLNNCVITAVALHGRLSRSGQQFV